MKEILLTQGQTALVDDEDYEWLSIWKWRVHKNPSGDFYAVRAEWDAQKKNNKKIHMQHEIMKPKAGKEVDRKDRNTLNNQKSNLRVCTHQQNMRNAKAHKKTSSGYKGVCFVNRYRKWRAYIDYDNKQIHLGYYSTPEGGARAYDKAARKYFGEFARTNFPQRVARRYG